MFLTSWQSVEADSHRQQLLAEAEAHRLGKAAKAARAIARHAAKPADPPPEAAPPQRELATESSAQRAPEQNTYANRRYAVSR